VSYKLHESSIRGVRTKTRHLNIGKFPPSSLRIWRACESTIALPRAPKVARRDVGAHVTCSRHFSTHARKADTDRTDSSWRQDRLRRQIAIKLPPCKTTWQRKTAAMSCFMRNDWSNDGNTARQLNKHEVSHSPQSGAKPLTSPSLGSSGERVIQVIPEVTGSNPQSTGTSYLHCESSWNTRSSYRYRLSTAFDKRANACSWLGCDSLV